MRNHRTFRTEFHEYPPPAEIIALVKAGKLIDFSWHNDTAPCFHVTADASVRLWTLSPENERYAVDLCDADGDHLCDVLETTSLAEVLRYLAEHHNIG
jgi:hypothetical protein